MTFKPVIEESSGPNLAGLGGLASLAGVSLPQSGSGDFATNRTLLRSQEVAERVIATTELLPAIFKNEWDAQNAQFREPSRGVLRQSLSGLKSVLTGDEKGDYIAPNPQRLSIFVEDTFALTLDKETGFLTVSAESDDPELIVALIIAATEAEANNILAGQLEASIVSLANSDVGSAGDQIEAVIGFSKFLREQEVVGRLAVNVLQEDPSVPVYLEDKDVLTIPKRPSHVSVVGSVNCNTMASYAPEKRTANYVAAAGGFTGVADKKHTYILLPNGESMPISEAVIIPPGAVLVVPPKVDKLSILGLTDVIARVLGNIATSVLAVNNVK